KHRASAVNDPVEGCCQPSDDRVLNPLLDILHAVAGVALVPMPIERFGYAAELHDEVGGKVLRLDLAAFLPPEPHQGRLIGAHYDPGIGSADESPPILCIGYSAGHGGHSPLLYNRVLFP